MYVNFLTEDETDRVKAAYGSNYHRLAETKKKYDRGICSEPIRISVPLNKEVTAVGVRTAISESLRAAGRG